MQDPLFELGFVIAEIQRCRGCMDRLDSVFQEKLDTALIKDGISVKDESENLFEIK